MKYALWPHEKDSETQIKSATYEVLVAHSML